MGTSHIRQQLSLHWEPRQEKRLAYCGRRCSNIEFLQCTQCAKAGSFSSTKVTGSALLCTLILTNCPRIESRVSIIEKSSSSDSSQVQKLTATGKGERGNDLLVCDLRDAIQAV